MLTDHDRETLRKMGGACSEYADGTRYPQYVAATDTTYWHVSEDAANACIAELLAKVALAEFNAHGWQVKS